MKIFLSLFSFHCTYYECSLLFSPLFIEFLMFHILEGPILHCIKYFYLCEALLSILVYLILTRHSHCPTVHLLRLREGKGISQGSIETDRVRIKRRLDFLLCQIPKTLGRFSCMFMASIQCWVGSAHVKHDIPVSWGRGEFTKVRLDLAIASCEELSLAPRPAAACSVGEATRCPGPTGG